jgi:hypothetical protein
MRFVRALFSETRLLAPLVASSSVDELVLKNGISIAIANFGSPPGWPGLRDTP